MTRIKTSVLALLALPFLVSALPAVAVTRIPVAGEGVSVTVDATSGAYAVYYPGAAWTFAGTLGQPLERLRTARGRDRIGAYDEVTFRWADGGPLSGGIRRYRQRPLALFTIRALSARQGPPQPFPAFAGMPAGLSVQSFENTNFSPVRFRLVQTSTPCLLYDAHGNTAIVSPAANFMVAHLTGDGTKTLASGLNPELRALPEGFTHSTLLAVGAGVNRTWETWGQALTDLQGKVRPANDADVYLKYLGYWTDNGAAYYYDYDPKLGYEGTMLAVRKHYQQEDIPIRYLQLDSWWYQKTTINPQGVDEKKPKNAKLPIGTWNAYGGLTLYRAHPALFPEGLSGFEKKLGLPLATHNRWVDVSSPYHKRYRISGVGAVDPQWWDDTMSYLKDSGVTMYEQDWLNVIYDNSPEFRNTTWAGDAFMDNMARASQERGLSLQYCMGQPRHFLQGSRYGNLTSIRVSDDRFRRSEWLRFLYTSRLASALGEWPWVDVFRSRETENMLLCTLSAGVVGVSDAIGEENKANIFRSVRADGVIVKPDVPIVPTDATYLAGEAADPIVASTETDNGAHRTLYVFSFVRKAGTAGETAFRPASLGLNGPVVVYDVFADTARRVAAGEEFRAPVPEGGSAYYVIAPVGESGIAFLGDRDKFVGTGRQRIASLRERTGALTARVLFAAPEESVTLHGYAASAPTLSVTNGSAGAVDYDAATGHFTVAVSPAGKASGEREREVTVSLRTHT